MRSIVILLFGALCTLVFSSCSNSSPQNNRPNIILVLADDMGYGDPGVYNPNSQIPTPHIDRIAQEGILFTDAHSPSAVCTPTRYGLLTGRYAWRTKLKSGVLWGYSPNMIDTARVTLPALLQENGYHTGGVGKWHLGLGDQDTTDYFQPFSISPLDHGFDYYYGIPASLDMVPYVYFEGDRVVDEPTEEVEASAHRRQRGGGFWRGGGVAPGFKHIDVLPEITRKATAFIAEHAQNDAPFFLYVPLSAPHTPWLPEESYRGKSGAGYYGDFAVQVDDTVGDILGALDEHGMTENTLIVFTSDNGAHWYSDDIEEYNHRANLHWRGQKADIWEGGHRVPFVARWPETIRAGSSSDELISQTDLMATIAAIIGADLPANAAEDSYNVLPAFQNKSRSTPIRQDIITHSLDGMYSIREGDWKLIEGRGSGGFTVPQRVDPGPDDPAGQLYNLADDPSERNNVYTQHPDIVTRLQERLNTYRDQGYSAPRLNQESL